tara:strand:- start:7 stop:402 length:396 start_codon:yes stop_codon:yes gene_type:complete
MLENNKLFTGLLILVVNIGSKYVALDFSKTQEEYFRNIFTRQLLIFAMAWTATRDLVISLMLTATFIILSDFIVNPESSLCMLPSKYKHMHYIEKQGKANGKHLVTDQELKQAKEVVSRGEAQRRSIETFA